LWRTAKSCRRPDRIVRCKRADAADELRALRQVSLTVRTVAGSAFVAIHRFSLCGGPFAIRQPRAVRKYSNIALLQFFRARGPAKSSWLGRGVYSFTLNPRKGTRQNLSAREGWPKPQTERPKKIIF